VTALKEHWPSAKLRWLINPEWAPLLEGNPFVDDVVLFPRHRFRGALAPFRAAAWLWAQRKNKSELVLDFQGLLRSAIVGRTCRGRRLIGLSDAREGARLFYDQCVPIEPREHAVDRYLRLTTALGVARPERLAFPLPHGSIPANDSLKETYVLLHPFSRGTGKSLSTDYVEYFCAQLAPIQVVVVGRSSVSLALSANCLSLLNATSLAELIGLIRRASFVVSVDSGPMHMAAAVTDRLLAIHTWSDPALVGPYNDAAWIWKGDRLFRRANPETAESASLNDLPGLIRQHVF
jgi:heptosyltransferase-1